jgi:hypothetical protein
MQKVPFQHGRMGSNKRLSYKNGQCLNFRPRIPKIKDIPELEMPSRSNAKHNRLPVLLQKQSRPAVASRQKTLNLWYESSSDTGYGTARPHRCRLRYLFWAATRKGRFKIIRISSRAFPGRHVYDKVNGERMRFNLLCGNQHEM